MLSPKLGIFLAFILLVAILVATAPARLLAYVLADSDIVGRDYAGTIWNGSMDSLVVPVAGQSLQLGKTRWRLSPWWLLLLTVDAEVEAQWGKQRAAVDVSTAPWRDLQFEDVQVTVDARLLRLFMPVELRGMAQLTAPALALSGDSLAAGAGRLVWQRARWIGNRNRQQLGDYVLEFSVSGNNQITGQVSSLSGPIFVEGTVALADREYSVDLQLRTDHNLSNEFRSALELMAAPTGDGYHVKFTTTL